MIYGSVCSGIEAASQAWEPLGWKPAWFAEIEPFPSAVLAHHWPHVTNLGDMTQIAAAILAGRVVAPDVLVGGTPCQAFSVAGAREGLADERGFLTIKYVELANAIDRKRTADGEQPCITVWENVPGVLSSKDNAFGAFLGLLAGEDCELVPPGEKWSNAGCVYGPQRAIAWRVIDAQYFGVAQRRRRVFVVSSAREGFDPAEILFEFESLRRDSAPSREKGTAVAALTANGVGTGGADDNQGQAGHLQPVIGALTARMGQNMGQSNDDVLGNKLIVCMAHGQGGAEIRDDGLCPTLTCNHEAPIGVYSVHGTQDPDTNTELAHTLGCNQGQENAVCLTQYGEELAGTLTARHDSSPCADRGANMVVAAFAENSRQEVRLEGGDGLITGALTGGGGKVGQGYPAAVVDMAVRRLMPVECERLQGFPDNWTRIPVKAYAKKVVTKLRPDDQWELIDGQWWLMAADGPRYKAIGNSMAVPCMAFIGRRLAAYLDRPKTS